MTITADQASSTPSYGGKPSFASNIGAIPNAITGRLARPGLGGRRCCLGCRGALRSVQADAVVGEIHVRDVRIAARHMAGGAYIPVQGFAIAFHEASSTRKRPVARLRAQNWSASDKRRDGPKKYRPAFHPAITRRCSREIASNAESTAPSCHALTYEACSPASSTRPSMAQRFL